MFVLARNLRTVRKYVNDVRGNPYIACVKQQQSISCYFVIMICAITVAKAKAIFKKKSFIRTAFMYARFMQKACYLCIFIKASPYSFITSGLLTFTRASNATRGNSLGLIEKVPKG